MKIYRKTGQSQPYLVAIISNDWLIGKRLNHYLGRVEHSTMALTETIF